MKVTSFRMIDGHVRNFQAHLDRLRSYQPMSAAQEEHLRASLRPTGTYNVKITCASGAFEVTHRPDRPVKDTITLWRHPQRDERTHPTVKGPDLYWLGRLKNTVQAHGADEALLVDDAGRVIECIYASVLAIEDHTIHVSDHPRALVGTTRPVVLDYLTGHFTLQVQSHPEGLPLELVRRSELLLTNAFHGAQHVTRRMEYGTTFASPTTLNVAAINRYLWRHADPVHS
ncbi:hypothetical protein C1Y63_08330 [Corynebacterium sp. 13CS0277]|uniref:aminotransferase class IV n=1 Tax=Corynebacterium sp. 13CS0277 TaxID=2071994 RepID=UPI000D035383|nr:aminotransferase class IV [Corynebacterium sp. 13CS0277]PRQ10996.1 hypothetical protein C1Y63_08330 [Corynebacterium sp. 13CS0277]